MALIFVNPIFEQARLRTGPLLSVGILLVILLVGLYLDNICVLSKRMNFQAT